MQAEGIRKGDKLDYHDPVTKQKVPELSWTAAADAKVSEDGTAVYVDLLWGDGKTSQNTYAVGAQVPISFGAGKLG